MKRGDIVLVYVANVGNPGGKLRPALVVQSDQNNARLNETIIAAITSNVARVHQSHQMLIDTSTTDGRASGSSSQFRRPVRASPNDLAARRSTNYWPPSGLGNDTGRPMFEVIPWDSMTLCCRF